MKRLQFTTLFCLLFLAASCGEKSNHANSTLNTNNGTTSTNTTNNANMQLIANTNVSSNTNNSNVEVTENANEVRQNKVWEEADEQANKVLETYTVKCGDKYYWASLERSGNMYIFTECQEKPTVLVTGEAFDPKELSEADKRNGVNPLPVAWKGIATIQCGLARQKQQYRGSPGFPWKWFDSQTYKLPMVKGKGKWQVDPWQAGYVLQEVNSKKITPNQACQKITQWAEVNKK